MDDKILILFLLINKISNFNNCKLLLDKYLNKCRNF